MSQEARTQPKIEPESFSVNNARQALIDLFDALPKSRRMEHLGSLNEILVVMEGLAKHHGGDRNKAV